MLEQATAISGIGAVSGYGWGKRHLWEGLLSGKPAATLVPGYGQYRDEDAWLALVSDEGDPADGPSRSARATRAAAREAINDAASRGWSPGRQVGVLYTYFMHEMDDWRRFYCDDGGHRRVRGYLNLIPSTAVSLLMQEYGFHGPAMNISAVCASGNAGLITAKMWLDSGIADDVVFVATCLSGTPEFVDHFVRLGVTVTDTEPLDACRPFQEGSRGFSWGEASVAFVLSRGNGQPYANVLGGAMSHDAYHVTSLDPSLTHFTACVHNALSNAGIDAGQVRYFNAHGSGTQQCDVTEAAILDNVLGEQTEVYSVKPLAGHCQGATGAVELAVAALAYEYGVIPASPRVAPGHPRLLDGATPIDEGITLKTSLGIGGHNTAVVLGAP
ncbi:3-oxoacyl-ACP synthase [Mycobacterium haemophilum DSM 44634]|uniref:beta-ketoacyl synthase N-terminal-like domain-containing protein n=1 Tax=Mycobacterium haemophilum TaxID=29311 RepID=UPI000655F88C|nr:beta-ketoacyl synthase N-terminal-like domain-containing protein [Mycobacterium haemophilum]AKN16920.1 3-oxoacyl-ACP synthase [Mycobacterium haemophilum DSM 44634]MCV7340327.1 3-oxoacyl-ACP synthase [Mycobacterium haemophilum DSM 44634]